MAALVLGGDLDADSLHAFLAAQADLGPKQWPSFIRICTELPRTVTFKVLKRQLSAEGTDCADPVWEMQRR
jgi:fatty-acyl-CoA synthase